MPGEEKNEVSETKDIPDEEKPEVSETKDMPGEEKNEVAEKKDRPDEEKNEVPEKKSSPFWKKALWNVFLILCIPAFAVAFPPLLLFIGIYYLFHSPFEKKKYKKSRYYRELGIKYCWGITRETDYLLYECSKELGLSMERCLYLREDKDGEASEKIVSYLWRRETETVVVLLPILESVYFDDKKQRWLANCDEDGRELKEAVKYACGDFVKQLTYPAKLLIEEGIFNDCESAKKEPFFLVYGKHRKLGEALCEAIDGGLCWEPEDETKERETCGGQPQ